MLSKGLRTLPYVKFIENLSSYPETLERNEPPSTAFIKRQRKILAVQKPVYYKIRDTPSLLILTKISGLVIDSNCQFPLSSNYRLDIVNAKPAAFYTWSLKESEPIDTASNQTLTSAASLQPYSLSPVQQHHHLHL